MGFNSGFKGLNMRLFWIHMREFRRKSTYSWPLNSPVPSPPWPLSQYAKFFPHSVWMMSWKDKSIFLFRDSNRRVLCCPASGQVSVPTELSRYRSVIPIFSGELRCLKSPALFLALDWRYWVSVLIAVMSLWIQVASFLTSWVTISFEMRTVICFVILLAILAIVFNPSVCRTCLWCPCLQACAVWKSG